MSVADHSDDARLNHLLAALPDEEFDRLRTELKPVSLALGEVIYESGEQLDHVYFPTTAIISLLFIMENGSTAEIGMAGNDGLVGIALYMGGSTTPNRAVVQSAGNAYKIRAKALRFEFHLAGQFQNILLRYTQYLMTQISQTAVCNRLHSVEQQLCRWLLINHDLLQTNKLIMTHDLIANMLGVRREGVSIAAGHLQQQGLIKYVRGTITMIDRPALEMAACECYQVVKEEYNRLLGTYISKNH
ncbi:MAG: Crp/Fnr family transcriptional regulator [Acidobacteria bacterium]|nr:Crp/Fnr family transcriptional regulator [Acidobacteriota bacterium]MBK8147400.1 Crp/Fnr family transcriptional regulator [Acidobacteriota bacterium]